MVFPAEPASVPSSVQQGWVFLERVGSVDWPVRLVGLIPTPYSRNPGVVEVKHVRTSVLVIMPCSSSETAATAFCRKESNVMFLNSVTIFILMCINSSFG